MTRRAAQTIGNGQMQGEPLHVYSPRTCSCSSVQMGQLYPSISLYMPVCRANTSFLARRQMAPLPHTKAGISNTRTQRSGEVTLGQDHSGTLHQSRSSGQQLLLDWTPPNQRVCNNEHRWPNMEAAGRKASSRPLLRSARFRDDSGSH